MRHWVKPNTFPTCHVSQRWIHSRETFTVPLDSPAACVSPGADGCFEAMIASKHLVASGYD
jgi:hypothetical protein